MSAIISSIALAELLREDAAPPDEQGAWRSRQQLRALYFALEQNGFVDTPAKTRAAPED